MAEKIEIEQHETLAEALLYAQSEYPSLDKGSTVTVKKRDGGSYSYKYADLAYTKKMTDPYLWKHGLVVNGKTEYRDGKELQVDTLRHIHSQEADVSEIEVTEKDMKLFGGNSTYAKRYNYCNLTGRVGEDDSENLPLDNRREPSREPDPKSVLLANIQKGEEALATRLLCHISDIRNNHFGVDGDPADYDIEKLKGYETYLEKEWDAEEAKQGQEQPPSGAGGDKGEKDKEWTPEMKVAHLEGILTSKYGKVLDQLRNESVGTTELAGVGEPEIEKYIKDLVDTIEVEQLARKDDDQS